MPHAKLHHGMVSSRTGVALQMRVPQLVQLALGPEQRPPLQDPAVRFTRQRFAHMFVQVSHEIWST